MIVFNFSDGNSFETREEAVKYYNCPLVNPSLSRLNDWLAKNNPGVFGERADQVQVVTTEELPVEVPFTNKIVKKVTETKQTQPQVSQDAMAQMAELMLKMQQLFAGKNDDYVTKEEHARSLEELEATVKNSVRKLEIKNHKGQVTKIETAHERFEDLLIHLQVNEPVLLVGPAGSFKTSSCEKAAQALGLDFYMTSVGMQTTKSDLIGFVDATGNYHRTPLREAYENGGVFLLDEMDAGNANTLTIMNAAISNGFMTFPDSPKSVKVHDDFRLVAAANTFGKGADAQYVGRNMLDAASLDRFNVIEWNYDEKLEASIAGKDHAVWVNYVQRVRAAVEELKINHVVSPRATFKGCKLLSLGYDLEKTKKEVLFKGMKDRDLQRVLEKVGKK